MSCKEFHPLLPSFAFWTEHAVAQRSTHFSVSFSRRAEAIEERLGSEHVETLKASSRLGPWSFHQPDNVM